MGSEEVIELSVSETQALRAKLGLPPLRGVGVPSAGSGNGRAPSSSNGAGDGDRTGTGVVDAAIKSSSNNDNEISLSIDETNALRAKIGLPPLRTTTDETKKQGTSSSTAIHAPPTNLFAENEAKKRIEDAAAKREAAMKLRRLERENEEEGGGEGESALDFAKKIMAGNDDDKKQAKKSVKDDVADGKKKQTKRKKKKKLATNPQLSLPADDEEEEYKYTSADLKGMKVAHSASDFAAGSTTVLTLADASILEFDPDSKKATGLFNGDDDNEASNNELINANMDGDSRALQNLKRKRAIEMGAGRAGGYAGYDDDEFEELGGIGTSGAMARGGDGSGGAGGKNNPAGFVIGADGTAQGAKDEAGKKEKSDIFAAFSGGAVSLQSRHGNKKIASDFLTHEEDDDGNGEMAESKEEKLEKERKKQAKILDKLRRKDKKKAKKAKKKKGRRERSADSDDEDDEQNGGNEASGGSLLASLEATAVKQDDATMEKRKRRRRNGEEDPAGLNNDDSKQSANATEDDAAEDDAAEDDVDDSTAKRRRFDKIMEKGKLRTDRAFNTKKATPLSASNNDTGDDDEEDDAFLNAALAKARRLKRLKELNGGAKSNNEKKSVTKVEDAVFKAVEKLKKEESETAKAKGVEGNNGRNDENQGGGGITFENDEMQEFTRALRAKEDQVKRAGGNGEKRKGRGVTISSTKSSDKLKSEDQIMKENNDNEGAAVEDVDMEELAQEIKEDDNANNANDDMTGAFGSTAGSASVGRGMSSFLSLLKQTGEISKHSGKEEMRGRAKDKRTYEDYEQLDLKKVVAVNDHSQRGGGAHEKDVEFANREIKLEYRDDFGRLLTRKEAYRNMCYQFHGHGSSQKNQERRLKQVEREREENKLASNMKGGTLGALKKTQKATGKAFIIHKT